MIWYLITLYFSVKVFDKKYAEIGIKDQDKVILLELESIPALFSSDLVH